MSWIARLDTRAKSWTLPTRVVYLTAKWGLIALGGFLVLRLWLDRMGLVSIY